MAETMKRSPAVALAEAARRWGKATLLVNPHPPQPAPDAPAAVETRRAA